jgi:hypothetical protein
MKKRSFLLLELLIAIFLLGTCALPLVQVPMGAMRETIKSCYRLQLQRIADLAFADIKTRLYQHEIEWKQLLKSSSKEKELVMDDTIEIALKGLGRRTFERRCYVYSVGKTGKEGDEHRLVTILIALQSKPHRFNLFPRKSTHKDTAVYQYELFISKSLDK